MMKKLIKLWDVVLIALLGVFGTGCNLLDPPPAEYGVEPMYGVPYSIQIGEEVQQDNQDKE